MSQLLKYFIVTFLLVSLNGCGCTSYVYGEKGIIRNRDVEYLRAQSYPHLTIPPCAASSTICDHYAIPPKCYPDCAKKVSLIPPELNNCNVR